MSKEKKLVLGSALVMNDLMKVLVDCKEEVNERLYDALIKGSDADHPRF